MSENKVFQNVLLGTVILSIVGLYNGYPLVFSDTGTYIYSGFDLFIPNDRPIAYALLLRLFSLKLSAWFVILFQNLLTAFVVYLTLKSFNFKKSFTKIYITTILFLTLFTGIAWYSNQLMPDFLAPVLILSIYLLLRNQRLPVLLEGFIIFTIIISSVSHFSHLIIGSILILTVFLSKLLFKKKLNHLSLNRLLYVTVVVLSGWFIMPSLNYIVEKKFILSKGSHVFMMASLNQKGILKLFLDENCSTPEFQNNRLCLLKDSLPDNIDAFIWPENSIVNKTGGWENSKEDYDEIIQAMHSNPKYLATHVYKAFCYGLIQLPKNKIGEGLSAYNYGSAPYGQIAWRFPHELNDYLNSRQNKWGGILLNFDILNFIHHSLLILSIFIVILLGSVLWKMDYKSIFFLIYVSVSVVINSFVTAGLSSPYDRFQPRVVWLILLAMIILLIKNYKQISDNFLPRKSNRA